MINGFLLVLRVYHFVGCMQKVTRDKNKLVSISSNLLK